MSSLPRPDTMSGASDWPYASSPVLMPSGHPMAMPEQDLARLPHAAVPPIAPSPRASRVWMPRAALFGGALLLTIVFAIEMYHMLALERVTPIQLVFLGLSTVAFGWIALGALSAAVGFLPLFAGEDTGGISLPAPTRTPRQRTALLCPVYHEDPARIAAAIEAMSDQLAALGAADGFDVFLLSDTRGDEAGRSEQAAYLRLAGHLDGRMRIYYRRRAQNTGKKAGNIHDWIVRYGGAYPQFLILDADSIMSGETLLRLALAMEARPDAGLIQTVPRLVGGRTLFQKLQQFATGTYGPSVAAGLAVWHGHRGNYWGHNAIIRTAAFAGAAGLPVLPGRAPFGGHVQSHDFVEAVLLQRAGWGVYMAPTVTGSYEGTPPTLIDHVVRDRRWAQGNLQHLAIVGSAKLTAMGRLHLAMGAMSYLVSAIWALSLAVGLVLALQGEHLIPSYFKDSRTLFPIWPVMDAGAALRLFVGTMAVVLLPKALGLALELKRVRDSGEPRGAARAVAGVGLETIFSMLFAPILMATQTAAVVGILLGRDSGWRAQRRDDGGLALRDVVAFHGVHVLGGIALAALCWVASAALLAWMLPVVLGLALAVPLTWLTARPAGRALSWLLSTEEERWPPAIVAHTEALVPVWALRLAEPDADAAADGEAQPSMATAA